MRSILGLTFAFLIAIGFFLQGLTNYADTEVRDVAKFYHKLDQYKTATGSHVLKRFEISNKTTQTSDSDRNSTSAQIPGSFFLSQDIPVEDVDIPHDIVLNAILSKVAENAQTSYLLLTSFDQSAIENIILSSLQTVVLLN